MSSATVNASATEAIKAYRTQMQSEQSKLDAAARERADKATAAARANAGGFRLPLGTFTLEVPAGLKLADGSGPTYKVITPKAAGAKPYEMQGIPFLITDANPKDGDKTDYIGKGYIHEFHLRISEGQDGTEVCWEAGTLKFMVNAALGEGQASDNREELLQQAAACLGGSKWQVEVTQQLDKKTKQPTQYTNTRFTACLRPPTNVA